MSAETNADEIAAKVCAGMKDLIAGLLGGEPLMTAKELAKALRVSVATVKRYRRDGMPFVQLSERCPRYRAAECIAWRAAKSQAPKPAPVVGGIRRISK